MYNHEVERMLVSLWKETLDSDRPGLELWLSQVLNALMCLGSLAPLQVPFLWSKVEMIIPISFWEEKAI